MRDFMGHVKGLPKKKHGAVVWSAYFIMAPFPFAESKGIQNRAYAEVAKGILSKIAL